jgi:hypothetical protein
MASDQGISVDQKGEQQPKDKDRAQTVHTSDNGGAPQKPNQNDQPNKDSVPG